VIYVPINNATSEENNHIHHPQAQEKMSISPTPSATRCCNFCKGEGHNASRCEAKRNPDADHRYRIVLATNMPKIYLDLEDGPQDHPAFYLVAHLDKDDRMRDTYIASIRIYPMWS